MNNPITTILNTPDVRVDLTYPTRNGWAGRPAGAPRDDQQTPFTKWLALIRSWKWLIAAATLAGAAGGFLFAHYQRPLYRSRATVELLEINPNFLNMRDVSPIAAASISSDASIQTEVKKLQGSTLIKRAAATASRKRTGDEREPDLAGEPKIAPAATPRDNEAIATAVDTLAVRAIGMTNIIEVTCASTNPEVAAAFLDALLQAFIDQNVQSRWESARRTSSWLTQQLSELKTELQRSEEKLHSYAQATGLSLGAQRESVEEERLRQIQQELFAAQADTAKKRSKYELALVANPQNDVADVVNDGTVREYQTKVTDLKRQLAELTTSYTPSYYKVRRMQAEIAEVEAALRDQRSRIISRIRRDYDEAQRREQLLSTAYSRQAQIVSEQSGRTVAFNTLKQDVDSNRQVYDSLLQRLREANVASALRADNVRILDAPEPASRPFQPRPMRMALLGSVLGLIGSSTLVIVRGAADRRLRSPADALTALGISDVGVIPNIRRSGLFRISNLATFLPAWIKDKAEPLSVTANSEEQARPAPTLELTPWTDKQSSIADSFRETVVSLLFNDRSSGSTPRVIVITSPAPQEGKTVITTNLGIAAAEIKAPVLLIEADAHRPRLHKMVGLKNDSGLSTVLTDTTAIEDVELKTVICETGIPGLHVLPSGRSDVPIWQLLCSVRMIQLISRLRREYELVLIDTAPILLSPDVRLLARVADGAVLVVRSGVSSRDMAQAALQKLLDTNTPVLGTILNDCRRSVDGYAYYSQR